MWSLFPKIYEDYKTLLYSSTTPQNTEPSYLPKLQCLTIQEESSKQLGKPNAPHDQKSCCMLMKKIREDLINKNIDINNYMIIENCSTELKNNNK